MRKGAQKTNISKKPMEPAEIKKLFTKLSSKIFIN
jgi:hypothetical protein